MSEGDGLPLLLLLLLLLLFHPIQPFPSQNPSKPEGKSETMRPGRYNVFRPRLKERTEMVFLYLQPVDTRDLFLARLLTRNCTQQTKRENSGGKNLAQGDSRKCAGKPAPAHGRPTCQVHIREVERSRPFVLGACCAVHAKK